MEVIHIFFNKTAEKKNSGKIKEEILVYSEKK